VDQAVEDGVGDGGVADHLVPGGDGVLTGDEDGAAGLPVFEDLQEEAVLVRFEVHESPVVDEEELDASQLGQQLAETSVAVGDGELAEQLGDIAVEGAEALPAGLVGQGASQIRLADAGRSGNQAVLVVTDPVAGGQLVDGGAVQASAVAEVDVFDAGVQLEASIAQPVAQRPVFLPRPLTLDELREAVLEAQVSALGRASVLLVGLGHAIEFHGVESVEGLLV